MALKFPVGQADRAGVGEAPHSHGADERLNETVCGGGIMKALFCGLGVLAAMTTTSMTGDARAIDLRNEDDRVYQIQITSSSMKRDVDLKALTLSLVVCVGECEFYVPGVGKTKARGNDVVLIRNGRIVTEAR